MTTKKLLFAMIAVLAFAVLITGCDSPTNPSNGPSDGNGSAGTDAPGEAEFTVSGDIEETTVEGAAYFELVDMRDLSSPADYRFDLQIAESWPFGTDTLTVNFSYSVDDADFFPKKGRTR